MLSDSEVSDVLETLEAHFSDKLSVWETDFVTNVKKQWEEGHWLSDRQRNKLDEIFERCAREHGR